MTGKLIAGETYDHQSLIFVLLIELFEFCELGSETTFAGSVDDEEHLSFVLRESIGRTFAGEGGIIVNHNEFNRLVEY